MNKLASYFVGSTGLIILFLLSVLIYGCSSPVTEINVAGFGAVADDGKDDTPAILAAIESCRGRKNVILTFGSGSYDIYGSVRNEDGNFNPSLIVKNLTGLTIDGHGAELIGHDLSSMFHFSGCQNLRISNLTTDWDPLPFVQGKVIKNDTGYVDIEVSPPFEAKNGLRTEAILGYDIGKNRMSRSITDHYQLGFEKRTEVVRRGVMRLFISMHDRFAGKLPALGEYVIVRSQVYDYQSFEFEKCSGIHLDNINIYSNPGMGVTGDECRDIFINHLRVMIRPGSGRWMSCTADATHFAGCRGLIQIENCYFEGMGDDASNVRSGHYSLVSERIDDYRIRVKPGYRYGNELTPPHVGDLIELCSGTSPLIPYCSLKVSAVEADLRGSSLLLQFTEKLPAETRSGDIAGNTSSCPVLRIRNCTTIRNRSRGFIIKTRDVLIEDCTFQDITECGIALESDVDAWWESISARNVIIRNNRFISGKSEAGYLNGVIESHTMSQNAPAGAYRNIIIDNNIFLGSFGNMIKLGSADSVRIVNNTMDGARDEAILLYNCKNIEITGNKVTNCLAGLKTAAGCDTPTIRMKDNSGF